MKEKAELVLGWWRKAQSDKIALEVTLRAQALDVACFHGQQAAEKYLKAFLIHQEAPFPYTHNLSKLVELCAQVDPEFRPFLPRVEPLTPYAVRPRYDVSFWPSQEEAEEAQSVAHALFEFVRRRLPDDIWKAAE